MPYTSYDHDKLEAAETMRIERRIYFEAKDGDIAPYSSLPIAQLLSMRSESAAAEQTIFDDLKERAAAWEEQAGRTLLLDKALEYVRTPHVQHTANEWQKNEYDRYTRSNRVYQMNYYIYENTRYNQEAQKSIPYSWTLTWSVRTNSPSRTQAKIAGQDRKVFTDKAAMEKYLNGRIKAYDRLFTEISPPIPQEYADYFKVNGMLMPDYTIEGEEPPQQQQAVAIPENTGQEKEREHMDGQFSIMIGNRSRFEAGDPSGYWLDMPATVPLSVIQSGSIDELNYLGKLLEMQRDEDKAKFAAAVTLGDYAGNLKDLINLAQNLDCYWIYPTVQSEEDYGHYLIDELDELELPEEAKQYFMYEEYGRDAVINDKGRFTEQGYIYNLQQQEYLFRVVQRARKRYTQRIPHYELPAAGA